jgi:hypothetical protein
MSGAHSTRSSLGRIPTEHRVAVAPGVRLLQGFVITMPFLHAFSVGPWMPLPLLYVIVVFALYTRESGALGAMYFTRDDLLIVVTLLLGILGYAVHWSQAGEKNFNHTLALCTTLFFFFFWMRSWLSLLSIDLERLGSAATIALMIASLAVQLEFVLVNTTGHYLADIIPYSTDDLPVADVLENFIRPRGLAAEPGFSAMVFEALGPLAWLYLRSRRRLTRWAAWLVILPGFVLLFSAGAMMAMLLAGAVTLATGARNRPRVALLIGCAVVVLVPILMWGQTAAWVFDQVIGRKITELFLGTDSQVLDVASRYDAFQASFEILSAKPFGIGWGMVSQMYSSGVRIDALPALSSRGLISLYAEIAVSAGILGLAAYLLFLVRKIVRLAKVHTPGARAVLFALLSVSIHHAFVLEFWFPMLWFLLAVADVLARGPALQWATALQPVDSGVRRQQGFTYRGEL